MEADNQNSWNSLRSNLDRLSEIPGEPSFDTDTAWNKLSGRLENKAIHRKPLFYWAAAAILLLVFSVALYQFRQPVQNKLVNNSSKNARVNSNLASDSELVKFDVEPAKQPLHPVQKVNTTIAIKKHSGDLPKKLRGLPVSTSLTKVTNQPVLNPEVSSAIALSILPNTPAVVQSKPVKLKVIHNNQLNSVIYKPELSVSNAPTTFSSSAGNLRFSRNASDNIIQIKLSLTN